MADTVSKPQPRATRVQTTQASPFMVLHWHATNVPFECGTEESGRAKESPGIDTGSCRAGRAIFPHCIMGNEGLPSSLGDSDCGCDTGVNYQSSLLTDADRRGYQARASLSD